MPVEVVRGSIGKLSLRIPWTSLSTNPVIVTLEDVYVVAAPLNHRPYDQEKDEQLDKTRKRRFLQKVEGISVIKKVATSQNSKVLCIPKSMLMSFIGGKVENRAMGNHGSNIHEQYTASNRARTYSL